MNAPKTFDILVLGATGFTGRLISRYLATHPQFKQRHFSFAIGARSQSKLHTLIQELALDSSIGIFQVDVGDYSSVETAVRSVRVVINTVGPYWRYGTPVVKACARNGVHYVDLSGEDIWIRDMILQFDYLATKTGAVIVPSCGYDSIPSDISAFLSNKTLKAHGSYDVGLSTTAHKFRGGISGGTFSTIMTLMEEVPSHKRREGRVDYSLSPVQGRKTPNFKFLYNQAIPGESAVTGGLFFMARTNKKIVQRSFGLLEVQAATANSSKDEEIAKRERYGSSFVYDEFMVMPSKLSSVVLSTSLAVGLLALFVFAPVRWLLKKIMPSPGSGPSEETMAKGYFEATNHTISTSTPAVHVKTVVKGDGDPGYSATAVMISESALCLLLPSISKASSFTSSPQLPDGLPALARKGGILTPVTAFGNVLVDRLSATGRFSFESFVVGQGTPAESRKGI